MTTPTHPSRLQRLLKLGLLMALAALVLVWPLAWALDATASKTVVFISKALPESEVAFNQESFDPEWAVDKSATPTDQAAQLQAEIAAIYGVNPLAPTKVLFVSDDALIRAKEDPELRLLVKRGDDYVLQVQTVYWFAKMLSLGAAGAALLLFGLLTLATRRAAAATTKAFVQSQG